MGTHASSTPRNEGPRSLSPTPRLAKRTPLSQEAIDVRRGLSATRKWLPSYLLYDARGSELYEDITELPEYYLTRTERQILSERAAEIAMLAGAGSGGPLSIVELGAGSGAKTLFLLRAVVAQQGHCTYVPVDVSPTALERARDLIEAELPGVRVQAVAGRHEEVFADLARFGPKQLALFIGSSIGNCEDADALQLLTGLRRSLPADSLLLLGTDLRKSPDVLLPAYDDARGVTASFNKNVLVRVNREFGGDFCLERFKHLARWNHGASRVEMHLESTRAQTVCLTALGLQLHFDEKETIHTESSKKYDVAQVGRLLDAAGFTLVQVFSDAARMFAVHLARARLRRAP